MFIDEAKIRVRAGDGGNGCVAFRREKYVPRGGPSGGDGGKGGDIYMESSERHNTLVHFRFNPEYKAQRGRHGEGANKTGREGQDIVLKVPVGTIVYDDDTGEKVHDFSHPDERIVVARGGRGGRGNARFATSTHQAPREHEDGRPGEERVYRLELKLLADVGLVGHDRLAGLQQLVAPVHVQPAGADVPLGEGTGCKGWVCPRKNFRLQSPKGRGENGIHGCLDPRVDARFARLPLGW